MVAKVFKLAAIGFLLGMIAGALICVVQGLAFNGGKLAFSDTLLALGGSDAGALFVQMLFSGLYGAVPMAGVIFYEDDSWGLLKQAVIHYATYTVAFMCVGISLGWIEPTLADMGLMAGIFAVCHGIIWAIMYARYKSEVNELNGLLEESKHVGCA